MTEKIYYLCSLNDKRKQNPYTYILNIVFLSIMSTKMLEVFN